MYQTILVPLDGTKSSERAVYPAWEELAPGGSLVLLHVIPPLLPTACEEVGLSEFHVDPEHPNPREETRQTRVLAYLTDVVRRYGGDPAAWRCEIEVSNSVPEAIVACARRVGADLIAMRTHGRRGLRRIMAASVAREVERKAPCQVRVFWPRELRRAA